eukprot:Blabericola_migrator_1__5847@NODE_2960_length_2165_cov_36_389418_g1851_i0_p1_GENE_NODE_2960_length_2165_cov_36_389418_g1851_i0NODE_2960_length_2165_cov_36_389418_g1851_i0_p1_ORF_typecomplete_len162_score25_64ADH_zinc_N/PF00107_26/1_4e18Glu_dehyd_C/PF16912_5/3_3e08ADH_zinc_N_2/PF13602_6/0_00035_NODE_2960_length_2165_cov_36_389418_g1851_i0100585
MLLHCSVLASQPIRHFATAVQWAASMNNEVIVMSRSTAKRDLALELGAKDVISTNDEESMAKYRGQLKYIVDTVSADKSMAQYVEMLNIDGVVITVGGPPTEFNLSVPPFSLIMGRKSIQGSVIGGIPETQEMLNYAAEKNIRPRIELITGDYVNEAHKFR